MMRGDHCRGLTERKSQQRGDLIGDHLTGQGCDFAAWLGLVPKESTGDRTILRKISKRGKYLIGLARICAGGAQK